MRRVIFIVLALLAVSAFPPQPTQAQADEAGWLLAQLNALRQSRGAGPLIVNPLLTAAATNHSNYLATHQWTNPHVEDNGSTPSSRAWAAGYTGKLVSENVVGGPIATKEWAFQWWVNEPIHFQNMTLPQWTEVGIGIVTGPEGRFYTMDFGTLAQGTIVTAAPPAPAVPATPAQAAAAQNPAVAVQSQAKVSAPPTKRPTPVPTQTPTITLTPSVTFTPHASFTPTFTATSPPPTMTAIVLQVSPPPPTAKFTMVAAISTPAIAVANPAPAQRSDPIRSLIPVAIALQVAVVGGMVLRSVIRRGRG